MWAQVASDLRDYKPSMYLLCFSHLEHNLRPPTAMRRRRIGEAIFARRKSNGASSGEKRVRRPAGGSPRSSAVQCESSSPLQLPPPLTMVLHCFSSGNAARDGDLCGEGREEGGAFMRYLSTASVRSRCSSYLGEDDQVPCGDLCELISRGPPGTLSLSPVAVSMSPWLSRST